MNDGDICVGKCLYDTSYATSISVDTVLDATSLEELQEKAKALKEKMNLYDEWCILLRMRKIFAAIG